MGEPAVAVEGLIELQKALRAADKALPRELRKANLEAAQVVAVRARQLAQGTKLGAKVAPSIRAAAEQRAAKLNFGGAKYPMAGGANFGARHDVPRQTARGTVRGWNQFPEAVRGRDQFIYAAVKDTTPEPLQSSFAAAVDAMLKTIETEYPFKHRGN